MTIELTAHYHLPGDGCGCAMLRLEGDLALALDDQDQENPAAALLLTVLHERFSGETTLHECPVSEEDQTGAFSLQLDMNDGESLTLIARQYGRIVASLLSEVEASEASRLLLYPKGGFDIVLHQQRCETPEEVSIVTARDQALIGTLTEPTGATAALADLLQAVDRHFGADDTPAPAVLCRLRPALDEAIGMNEEAHSHEMIGLLCTTLEDLDLDQQSGIVGNYTLAQL